MPGVEQGAFQCRKQEHALDAVRRGTVNDGRELGPFTEIARVSAPHRCKLEGWCCLTAERPWAEQKMEPDLTMQPLLEPRIPARTIEGRWNWEV